MANIGNITSATLSQVSCGIANLTVHVVANFQLPFPATINSCTAKIMKGGTIVATGPLNTQSGTLPSLVREGDIAIPRMASNIQNGDVLTATVTGAWTLTVSEGENEGTGPLTVAGCPQFATPPVPPDATASKSTRKNRSKKKK